jgi:hypothetical protein
MKLYLRAVSVKIKNMKIMTYIIIVMILVILVILGNLMIINLGELVGVQELILIEV